MMRKVLLFQEKKAVISGPTAGKGTKKLIFLIYGRGVRQPSLLAFVIVLERSLLITGCLLAWLLSLAFNSELLCWLINRVRQWKRKS